MRWGMPACARALAVALLIAAFSFAAEQVTPTNVQLGTTTTAYTTQCGIYTYFSVVMQDPCKDLVITTTPSAGEPKIFVSKTQQNPTTSSKSWAAWALGVYTVTVSHWQPESSPGKYYIGVYADCSKQSSAATYTLSTSAVTTDDGTDIYLHSGFSTSVSVPAGGYKNFHFCMPAQTSATAGVSFIGGTLGLSSTKLIVAKVIGSGSIEAGMAISGVGINSPCHILSCVPWAIDNANGGVAKKGAQSYVVPSFSTTSFLECTMDSTQNIPGPLSYEVSATTSTSSFTYTLPGSMVPCFPFNSAQPCATPSTNVPTAGFTVVGTSGTLTGPVILQSGPTSTSATLGSAQIQVVGDKGVMGLAITGFMDTSSGTPSFSQPSQFAAMRGRTADSSVFGDACGDIVISWKMTTADNRVKYPDVLLSRTATSPKVEGYVWRRSDFNSFGTYTIPYDQAAARDSNGYLSGSWFLSLYGWCAYSTAQDRSKSKVYTDADDDAYATTSSLSTSGKCRTNDAPTTVTVSVAFVPRPSTGQCTTAAQAVPSNTLPSYTELTSGSTVTATVSISSNNYYMIANPSPCNSMTVYVETKYADVALTNTLGAQAASGATTLTMSGSISSSVVVGTTISGLNIPSETTITAVNTGTKVLTISKATTGIMAVGTTVTFVGVPTGGVYSYDLNYFSAETAMAKWPTTDPDIYKKGWSGYSSFNQNYTIDAWDPAFDGGNTCGSDKKQPCYYFINVFPYGSTTYASITYTITVTLKPQKRIFGTPQLNQIVGANAVNSYKFCVNPTTTPDADAQVQLFEYTDACQCPDTYSDLEMVVSSSMPGAGIDDNVWRVGYGNKPSSGLSTINLLATDTDTRVGTYYLNVIGHCTASADCHNECKCAPCTNLPSSPYAVSVSNYGTSIPNPQSSCTNYESYSPYGQAQCCYSTPNKISQLTKELGRATMTANAAISMITLTWVFCGVVGIYYAYRYFRGAWVPLPLSSAAANDWKDADVEMAPKPVVSRLSGHGSGHGSAHGRL